MKKVYLVIIIVIAILLTMLFIKGTNNSSSTSNIANGKIESVSGLPNDYKTFKIQINGKLYNMPLSVKKIKELGFKPQIHSYEDNEIAGRMLTSDTYEYSSITGKSKIEIGFYNPDEKTAQIKDCKVSSIYINKNQVNDDSVEIVFPGGIQLGSTFEKVKNVYGEYDEIYKTEKYNVYIWKSTEQSIIKIYIDTKTNRVTEMFMQKIYD